MTQSAVVKIETARCTNLRWKAMFFECEPDWTVPRSEDPPCWCLRTQNCLGPDGEVVDTQGCNANRTCYEGQ